MKRVPGRKLNKDIINQLYACSNVAETHKRDLLVTGKAKKSFKEYLSASWVQKPRVDEEFVPEEKNVIKKSNLPKKV